MYARPRTNSYKAQHERRLQYNNSKTQSTVSLMKAAKNVNLTTLQDASESKSWLESLEDPGPNLFTDPKQLTSYYERFHSQHPRLDSLSRPKTRNCGTDTDRRNLSSCGVSVAALKYVPSERVKRLAEPKVQFTPESEMNDRKNFLPPLDVKGGYVPMKKSDSVCKWDKPVHLEPLMKEASKMSMDERCARKYSLLRNIDIDLKTPADIKSRLQKFRSEKFSNHAKNMKTSKNKNYNNNQRTPFPFVTSSTELKDYAKSRFRKYDHRHV